MRSGDVSVVKAFCERVLPQVVRTTRRLLSRHDNDWEDCAQLALFELIRSVGDYRGDCSLDTWTAVVTAHVVSKQMRRRSTHQHVPLDSVSESALPSTSITAERVFISREALGHTLRHLEAIGEKQARSFVLHDLAGYDLREVASILKVSEAAAQSRLVRGRSRLLRRIEHDPELADLMDALVRSRRS